MQYTEKNLVVKMKMFTGKILIVFLTFAQNIDCGYTLEPPRGSNEYPQSMFWTTIYVLNHNLCFYGGIHCTDMFS